MWYSTSMITDLRNKADYFGVRKIANFILNDPRFPLWSGSSRPQQHHHGTGGLLIHVSEVVNMCLLLRKSYYPDIDGKVLFVSALMHDWGKLWDYEPFDDDGVIHHLSLITPETQWHGASHKRNIHHISRSAIEWSKAVALSGECKDIEEQVTHAILSHHGQREWGSPVAPNSHVAWLLHCCDIINARMEDCGTIDYLELRR